MVACDRRTAQHHRRRERRRHRDHLCDHFDRQRKWDQGADPNKLIVITDTLSATGPTPPSDESFATLRTTNNLECCAEYRGRQGPRAGRIKFHNAAFCAPAGRSGQRVSFSIRGRTGLLSYAIVPAVDRLNSTCRRHFSMSTSTSCRFMVFR